MVVNIMNDILLVAFIVPGTVQSMCVRVIASLFQLVARLQRPLRQDSTYRSVLIVRQMRLDVRCLNLNALLVRKNPRNNPKLLIPVG